MGLYGRYYKNEVERRQKTFDSGYTTQCTDDAIVAAITSPAPKARSVWI